MSHSLRDRGAHKYCAVLGAEGVGLGRWHANQQQWLGSREFSCEAAQPAWEAAVEALAALLAEHAVRGAQLRVLLSARYSRFCLVPWSDAIGHPRELDAYARACFENLYGQSLGDWRIVLSPEPAGAARIATALPEALLQRLQGYRGQLLAEKVDSYEQFERCRELGIRTVAVHSVADTEAKYVKLADEAFSLHGETAAETYLVSEKLILSDTET